ncbi:MAG: hypothetical protein IPG25_04200 [Proteobacteria bacterium]|nr:hypothetical protein [Pseudomonadota bacterium]
MRFYAQCDVPLDFISIFRALTQAEVRYVLVGGLAVILHGVDRVTADIDLTLDLAPDQAKAAIETLLESGLKPQLPIAAVDFADPAKRASWHQRRNMQVFSFWDPTQARPTVDLFIENPIPFEELWQQSVVIKYDDLPIRIASIGHLIRLKEIAGRPRDTADIAALRELLTPP